MHNRILARFDAKTKLFILYYFEFSLKCQKSLYDAAYFVVWCDLPTLLLVDCFSSVSIDAHFQWDLCGCCWLHALWFPRRKKCDIFVPSDSDLITIPASSSNSIERRVTPWLLTQKDSQCYYFRPPKILGTVFFPSFISNKILIFLKKIMPIYKLFLFSRFQSLNWFSCISEGN